MKKINFLSGLLLLAIFAQSQNEIKVRVTDLYGTPINGAEVYYCDETQCQNKITTPSGEASFNMLYKPTVIIAFDTKGRYGLKAERINQSAAEYSITLPSRPVNEQQAGEQLDGVWNNIVGYYSTYRDLEDLSKAYSVSVGTKALGGISMASHGVPGVFSISPLPVVDKEGKLGLQLSGLLADKIIQVLMLSKSKITGQKVYYQYTPSM